MKELDTSERWFEQREETASAEPKPGRPRGAAPNEAVKIVPAPSDPMAVARAVRRARRTPSLGGVLLLRHHRNTFYRYAGDHWPEDDERRVALRAVAVARGRAVTGRRARRTSRPSSSRSSRTTYKIANVVEALKAIGHIAQAVAAARVAARLDGRPYQRGRDRRARERDPRLRDQGASRRTPRSCSSGTCSRSSTTRARRSRLRWLQFLDELWFDDDESKADARRVVRLRPLERDRPAEDVPARRTEAVRQGHDRARPDRPARRPQHGGADARRADAELRPAAADREAARHRSPTRASAPAPTA